MHVLCIMWQVTALSALLAKVLLNLNNDFIIQFGDSSCLLLMQVACPISIRQCFVPRYHESAKEGRIHMHSYLHAHTHTYT